MASDFSRKTFDRLRQYSGVLMQQGRVQLDSDWNEQLDIEQYRTHTETRDVIGESGVPRKGNSFQITAINNSDLSIGAGRMYAGGLLCELENAASYLHQPYYPKPDLSRFLGAPGSPPNSPPSANSLTDGTYVAYIEAWQREVSHLDDPRIREVALGEADTTTRLQTVWQVKLLSIGNSAANCKSNLQEWTDLTAPSTGTLNVRTVQSIDPNNPCILPSQSGYRRLENQLYRVEVHRGGPLAQATFKWSRENASVETAVLAASGGIVSVADLGKDEVLGFAPGQWVEIVDEAAALNGTPNPLRQIISIDHGRREITLGGAAISLAGKTKLRRWEQLGTANGLPASSAWLDLEGGIQVMFSNGSYRPGDFWLIPARTATGEVEWPPYQVPNTAPLAQLPHGTPHFYCRLAMVKVSGGVVSIEDCRPLFSPLTELEDCDLREHNKHLHGYGVVCGLKMKCLPGRKGVMIEKGYALDCEGYPIRAKQPILYDILGQPGVQKILEPGKGNGTFCVTIARGTNNSPVISIEPHVPQKFWDRVLEGTLLKDFYDDCILSLINFLKQQFQTKFDDTVPVPQQQRRLTSFVNLFAQLLNSQSGPYGFISQQEHDYLHKFYLQLRKALASETFCGMYDGDDPFPDYPLDGGLDTVFGSLFRSHHRLRLHPDGTSAYTCGNDHRVSVYNLEKGELVQTIPFPAAVGVVVQDIVLDSRGRRLFAVCVSGNDSTFAVADVKDGGLLAWGTTSTVPGTKYVSLAMGPNNQLFAIAKAQGLHIVNGVGTTGFSTRRVGEPFNATGLLHLNENGDRAYAAQSTNAPIGTESTIFDLVRIISFDSPFEVNAIRMAGVDAANDIATFADFVFVTGDGNSTGGRVLAGFERFKGNQLLAPTLIDNNAKANLRLAVYTAEQQSREGRYVLVSNSDRMKVVRVPIDFNDFRVDDTFRIPTQLFPMDIALDAKGNKGYALNMIVNTLTTMDMSKVFRSPDQPNYSIEKPEDLAEYRDQAIEAYRDLLNHLLQSLKDCFCDKFLVDCPECGEQEKIYLGCVEIKDFQVYHICNFNKRKYVKTFPTVEYWLSTLPVLPMLREAFGMFCCSVLDIELFKTKTKGGV